MSRKPKELYIAVCDNRVVCYHVSLLAFYNEFRELEPTISSHSYYQKEFKKRDEIPFNNVEKRKTYYLIQVKP